MKNFENREKEQIKIENPQKYLALYDLENYLFEVVGPEIRKRGYINFEEFYNICMWKSSRQKKNYLKNQEKIEKITKEAFKEKDELLKIEKLRSLDGVEIPTASAILTIVFPDKYGVIDIRCAEILEGYGIKKTMTTNNWLRYLEVIRQLARDNNLTPRDIDKILFAMHREKLEKENYKNLYKK